MSTEKKQDSIDMSKITEKERSIIQYKATQEPMTKFEKLVGNDAGISRGSANNSWQNLKKEFDMTGLEIIILERTTDTFNKKN